jgi:hypothetical protein
MEQKERNQKTNVKKRRQCGCWDMTSEETRGKFRMMPFSFDRFENFFYCSSRMENMSKKFNNKNS